MERERAGAAAAASRRCVVVAIVMRHRLVLSIPRWPSPVVLRRIGTRRRARLNAGSVSGYPSPNPACAFRYAPGSPSTLTRGQGACARRWPGATERREASASRVRAPTTTTPSCVRTYRLLRSRRQGKAFARHIHGLSRRLHVRPIDCLPSPCTRLSRARTTTKAPPLDRDSTGLGGVPDDRARRSARGSRVHREDPWCFRWPAVPLAAQVVIVSGQDERRARYIRDAPDRELQPIRIALHSPPHAAVSYPYRGFQR
jgi:hypothetical protein